jgi:hypothetical protein
MKKTSNSQPMLLAALTTLGLAATAWSQVAVTIQNPGFEANPLADGDTILTQSLTNWTGGYTSESDDPSYSVWVSFAGDSGATNPAAAGNYGGVVPQGDNAAFAVTFSGLRQGIRQILAETVSAGASYDLSVKVGNPDLSNNGAAGPGYVIEIVVNGTVVAAAAGASPASGTFATVPLNWVAPTAGDPLVGQAIEIRLLTADNGSNGARVDFDDVTLTRSLLNPIANPGGPYVVPIGGTLALNGGSSQPSNGQTLTLYEWDLNNDGTYDVTGVTPAPISDADLKTTYGMKFGSNPIALRVTDDSSPTPKFAVAAGSVKLSPPIACQLGVLDLAANGGINPNTGVPWEAGDKYRVAFHTVGSTGTLNTVSNDPAVYNNYVTAEAHANEDLVSAGWFAMVTVNLDKTTTQALSPKWTVKENTGTGDLTGGAGVGGAGFPVYAMDGTTCIARNNADIWNNWSNPFASNSTLRTGTAVFYTPFLNQFGNQTVTPDANHGIDVATGCDQAGNHVNALGNTTDVTTINRGNSNPNNSARGWNRFTDPTTANRSFYAISNPLTIVDLSDSVDPELVSIEDDRSGEDTILGVDSIVYTVTFDEGMDLSTINVEDFENAGTATVEVDSVVATLDSKAFKVTVTPTTTGTVTLRVKAGAVFEDFVGNPVDTTSPIADDVTITVVADPTPPTLVSIEDNVSGGPVVAFNGFTYTVTFDEAIDADTLSVEDFGNGGTAPITVTSVLPTGNPAVFTVAVNTSGAGDLTLQIVAGATILDLSGNPLATTTALPDDTTITVTPDPLPTVVSIADSQDGGPVFATQSFSYQVTFDQVIVPGTVDVTDFENGGTPAITVNEVVATSNPSVFTVHVTPGGAGTITLRVKAGAVITNTNGTALDTTAAIPDDTTLQVNAGSGPPRGTITVGASASWSANAGTLTGTLNAAGASKLVVIVTGENGNPGSLAGNCSGVTYDGVPLIQAVDRSPLGGTPVDQTFNDIWYLDNPTTATGQIVASVNTRGSVTAIVLTGTAPGVGEIAISPQASKSVVLSTGFANSLVIAAHAMGGDGNTANVTAVQPVLPLDGRRATAQTSGSPSPWDGHVTAYAAIPASATATYSFTGGNLVGSHTIAAEFLAAEAGAGGAFDTWAGGPFQGTLTDPDPELDFDGGGLDTGIEWVVGGDPTLGSDDAGLAPTLDTTSDPEFLIFTYREADIAAADPKTQIAVQFSNSLGGWTNAVDDGTNIIITPTELGAVDSVEVKLRRSVFQAGGRLFARLRVVVSP